MSLFDDDEFLDFIDSISVRDEDESMKVWNCDDLSDEMFAIEQEVEAELKQELLDECGLDREDYNEAA